MHFCYCHCCLPFHCTSIAHRAHVLHSFQALQASHRVDGITPHSRNLSCKTGQFFSLYRRRVSSRCSSFRWSNLHILFNLRVRRPGFRIRLLRRVPLWDRVFDLIQVSSIQLDFRLYIDRENIVNSGLPVSNSN